MRDATCAEEGGHARDSRTRRWSWARPWPQVGHIPGFKAGDKFRNKGELAITGIHCNIAGGIYCQVSSLAITLPTSAAFLTSQGCATEPLLCLPDPHTTLASTTCAC